MKDLESFLPGAEERSNDWIFEKIQSLEVYQNYQKAFVEATGLPLGLATAGGSRLTRHVGHHANSFCELMAGQNKTCQSCIGFRRNLTLNQESGHQTSICFAGLCESCVPIQTGSKIIGYLLTGEVATDKPTPARFAKVVRKLREWQVDFNESHLRAAYFSTRIVSPGQYRSILELLTIFANHLSLIADQIVLHDENTEEPGINRACEFIKEHFSDALDLKSVAEQACLSSSYFCKKFKESKGLTFTAYVSRTRVEAAKKMLLNPKFRISEVAYEVGFQSLTQFNRVFKEISGQSPTQYRKGLHAAAGDPAVHRTLRMG